MTGSQFADRRVLIMGLGRFGGGIGAARWMCAQGARVTVTDLADRAALAESVEQLADGDIDFRLGGHDAVDLDGVDLAIISPAVPRDRSPFFAEIAERGIPWTTEINLFLERCPGRVIGVTGTAGKSTTCALINEVLKPLESPERQIWFGGNVGRSLLADLHQMGPEDIIVLELSSFQLETIDRAQPRFEVGLITNAWPNHLDRHGDFEAYLDAKLNLFRHLESDGVALVGPGDEALRQQVRSITEQRGARIIHIPEPATPFELRIPGRHNQVNAECAAAIGALFGVDERASRIRMAGFAGLPHRMEHLGRIAGVDYYNDSKTTTTRGVATALAALDCPVILIAGGQDRGEDLSPLIDAAVSRAKAVFCVGASGQRIARTLSESAKICRPATVEISPDLSAAVSRVASVAVGGDAVVLSPGAPSYDQFANYEQRGEAFRRLVETLPRRQ